MLIASTLSAQHSRCCPLMDSACTCDHNKVEEEPQLCVLDEALKLLSGDIQMRRHSLLVWWSLHLQDKSTLKHVLSVVNAESPMLEFGLRIKKKKRKKSYNANATELILMQTAEQTEECYALS